MNRETLVSLMQERIELQQQLNQLDQRILENVQTCIESEYVAVSSEAVKFCIEKHKRDLTIDDLVSCSGVSIQTYYNAIKRVDVVSVGKLNRLLVSIGLQLFVGKRLK